MPRSASTTGARDSRQCDRPHPQRRAWLETAARASRTEERFSVQSVWQVLEPTMGGAAPAARGAPGRFRARSPVRAGRALARGVAEARRGSAASRAHGMLWPIGRAPRAATTPKTLQRHPPMTHATTRGLLVLALTAAVAACGESPQGPDAPPAAPATLATPVQAFAPFTGGETAAAGNCSLDAINGAPVPGASVAAGSEAMFGGWAVDGAASVPDRRHPRAAGCRGLRGAVVAGVESPDVATALNSEQAACPDSTPAPGRRRAAGEYGLSIVHTRAARDCDLKATLTVTQD